MQQPAAFSQVRVFPYRQLPSDVAGSIAPDDDCYFVATASGTIQAFSRKFSALLVTISTLHPRIVSVEHCRGTDSLVTLENEEYGSFISSYHGWRNVSDVSQVKAYTLPLGSFSECMAVCPATGLVAVLLEGTVSVWSCGKGRFQHVLEIEAGFLATAPCKFLDLNRRYLLCGTTQEVRVMWLDFIVPKVSGSSAYSHSNAAVQVHEPRPHRSSVISEADDRHHHQHHIVGLHGLQDVSVPEPDSLMHDCLFDSEGRPLLAADSCRISVPSIPPTVDSFLGCFAFAADMIGHFHDGAMRPRVNASVGYGLGTTGCLLLLRRVFPPGQPLMCAQLCASHQHPVLAPWQALAEKADDVGLGIFLATQTSGQFYGFRALPDSPALRPDGDDGSEDGAPLPTPGMHTTPSNASLPPLPFLQCDYEWTVAAKDATVDLHHVYSLSIAGFIEVWTRPRLSKHIGNAKPQLLSIQQVSGSEYPFSYPPERLQILSGAVAIFPVNYSAPLVPPRKFMSDAMDAARLCAPEGDLEMRGQQEHVIHPPTECDSCVPVPSHIRLPLLRHGTFTNPENIALHASSAPAPTVRAAAPVLASNSPCPTCFCVYELQTLTSLAQSYTILLMPQHNAETKDPDDMLVMLDEVPPLVLSAATDVAQRLFQYTQEGFQLMTDSWSHQLQQRAQIRAYGALMAAIGTARLRAGVGHHPVAATCLARSNLSIEDALELFHKADAVPETIIMYLITVLFGGKQVVKPSDVHASLSAPGSRVMQSLTIPDHLTTIGALVARLTADLADAVWVLQHHQLPARGQWSPELALAVFKQFDQHMPVLLPFVLLACHDQFPPATVLDYLTAQPVKPANPDLLLALAHAVVVSSSSATATADVFSRSRDMLCDADPDELVQTAALIPGIQQLIMRPPESSGAALSLFHALLSIAPQHLLHLLLALTIPDVGVTTILQADAAGTSHYVAVSRGIQDGNSTVYSESSEDEESGSENDLAPSVPLIPFDPFVDGPAVSDIAAQLQGGEPAGPSRWLHFHFAASHLVFRVLQIHPGRPGHEYSSALQPMLQHVIAGFHQLTKDLESGADCGIWIAMANAHAHMPGIAPWDVLPHVWPWIPLLDTCSTALQLALHAVQRMVCAIPPAAAVQMLATVLEWQDSGPTVGKLSLKCIMLALAQRHQQALQLLLDSNEPQRYEAAVAFCAHHSVDADTWRKLLARLTPTSNASVSHDTLRHCMAASMEFLCEHEPFEVFLTLLPPDGNATFFFPYIRRAMEKQFGRQATAALTKEAAAVLES